MKKLIRRYLKLGVSILFALSLSQMPRYIELYLHVLRGALLEVERSIEILEKQASYSNKSLAEYIRKHLNSDDTDFRNTGLAILSQLKRRREYKSSIGSLQSAAAWNKPFIFIKNFDYSIARSVDFKPALSITEESLIYILASFLLCLIFIPPVFKF